jgi:hypothetical protein
MFELTVKLTKLRCTIHFDEITNVVFLIKIMITYYNSVKFTINSNTNKKLYDVTNYLAYVKMDPDGDQEKTNKTKVKERMNNNGSSTCLKVSKLNAP